MNVFNQCRTDSACHYLHQAMECYNLGKYSQTLKLTQLARKAIFSPHSVFDHDLHIGVGRKELSIETLMKKHSVGKVDYDNNIPELWIETFICRYLDYLPAATCALFLQYLSYNKLGFQRQRDEALFKLSHVIQHDAINYITSLRLDISWQILGICQQMSGDNRAAFHSYRMALHTKAYLTHKAVFIRLGTLLAKYFLDQRSTKENSTKKEINKLKR